MFFELLVLAITLSLDNVRAAVALGTVPFSRRRAVQVALTFGLWDGVAPLIGLLVGRLLGDAVGPIAEYVGPAVLAIYGIYLLIQAWRSDEVDEEFDHRWALFGIPFSLSFDNMVAGTGLGFLGYSVWVSALTFAASTAILSFVGLYIGRALARVVRIRADLLGGIALVAMAIYLALDAG